MTYAPSSYLQEQLHDGINPTSKVKDLHPPDQSKKLAKFSEGEGDRMM